MSDTNILDSILENSGPARIVSEEHDVNNIKIELSGVDGAIRRLAPGGWDSREYGISLEEAERRFQEANTPEARERVMQDLRQRAIQRAGLDNTTGRIDLVFTGEPAWHFLGMQMDKVMTGEEVKQNVLKWTVSKRKLSFQKSDGSWKESDSFGIVRDDTEVMLSKAGSGYKVIQNHEAIEVMENVLAPYGVRHFESAGSISCGERFFILANMPNLTFEEVKGSPVCAYIAYQGSHVLGESDKIFPTSVRMVCKNTFNLASRYRRGKGISIRHMGNTNAKIDEVQKALGISVKGFDEYKENVSLLAKVQVPDSKEFFKDVLDTVIDTTEAEKLLQLNPLDYALDITQAQFDLKRKAALALKKKKDNALEDILERYESERCGVGGIRGTLLSVKAAVEEHGDYGQRYKGSQHDRQSRRFESTLYGYADDLKQVAYEKAMEYTR